MGGDSTIVEHFMLCNYNFPVTLHIPFRTNQDSITAIEFRTKLHHQYVLPLDYPIFRTECALLLQNDTMPTSTTRLQNVHIGIPSSPVVGGTQHVVSGKYAYYHYLQDSFNDKGWGCAYRSLQTIASWLYLNYYTTIQPPTHLDIQQALVRMGDKPTGFVGSSGWIGSVEVGYCLDERYGIVCKGLYVDSGHALANKGRELAQHFEDHGTPIMMGGGVLALTILGIDYNETTGDIAFLILVRLTLILG